MARTFSKALYCFIKFLGSTNFMKGNSFDFVFQFIEKAIKANEFCQTYLFIDVGQCGSSIVVKLFEKFSQKQVVYAYKNSRNSSRMKKRKLCLL